MSAPPGMNKGHSNTGPPLFNEKYYGWWKAIMENFLTAEDYKLWKIILDWPNTPIKLDVGGREVPKERSGFNDTDRKLMEKNAKANNILICGMGPNEYKWVSACTNANTIWDTLQTAHKGTSQVKRSRIEMFLRSYELLTMKDSIMTRPILSIWTSFFHLILHVCFLMFSDLRDGWFGFYGVQSKLEYLILFWKH